jgi:hypothetical protein
MGTLLLGMTTGWQITALVLTFVIHLVGAAALVWAMLGDGERSVRGWWPRDDGGQEPDPRAPEPRPSGPGLPVPLPDAAQSGVRLREPGRLGDALPRPARRPAHPPVPAPQRDRETV